MPTPPLLAHLISAFPPTPAHPPCYCSPPSNISPPFFQLPAYLPGGRKLLSPPASPAHRYLTQGEHCWRAVLLCPAVVWPEAQAATRVLGQRCPAAVPGAGGWLWGEYGSCAECCRGNEGSAEAPWKGEMRRRREKKKGDIKEKWRREMVKQRYRTRGWEGKCINGRKQKGRKNSGVKTHHGISGERESDSCWLRGC